MKITAVETILTSPNQNYLFVKIHTDSGIYGVGDASLNGRELPVANLIDNYLAPILIGKNPEDIEDIWHYIYTGAYWRGGNVVMSALSGIDTALWDILGKSTGKPLYALLGGKVREKVLCYAHVPGKSAEEKAENAKRLVEERQYKVIRLRVGRPASDGTFGETKFEAPLMEVWDSNDEIDNTVEAFAKVREAVGPAVGLVYDLHERFSPEQAIRVIKKLEKYNPFFVEDPVRPECIQSLAYLRSKVDAPIAYGELYTSRNEYVQAICKQLVDFIRCDIIRVGGITEARKICSLAEFYDVKTAWHGPNDVSPVTHAVNWHMNISSINCGIQEDGNINDTIHNVISGGPTYKDGYLYMADKPGIGCDIDVEAAKKYPYKKAYIPYCRTNDGNVTPW